MKSVGILIVITVLTLLGDYCIKLASSRSDGLRSLTFVAGVIFYGLPAIGWYFLMQLHSLAAIGVFYSAATILLLAGLGYFVFDERLDLREMVGLAFAIGAIVLMGYKP